MGDLIKKSLVFIDPNEEWLEFVRSTLEKTEKYRIATVADFSELSHIVRKEKHFDLIFIGLSVVHENIETLSNLAQTSSWQFIVLFPGFPDGKTARILFRAGMRDLLSKPYDPQSLKNMVEEELNAVEQYRKRVKALKDDEYISRVHRLLESVQSTKSDSS